MSMAKKGTTKAKSASSNKPVRSGSDNPSEGSDIQKKPEEYSLDIPEAQEPKKAGQKKPSSDRWKYVAVFILAVLVIIFAVFYFISSSTDFVPGQSVTPAQFQNELVSAGKVFILMDVRGAQNASVRGSIMQCGVDFAESTYLGSKNVSPLSFDNKECTDANGTRPLSECASELKDGITIDIRAGQPAVRYFSNGMLVTVGPEYTLGSCGINSS